MSNYRGNYLFGFITCGPIEHIPEFAFSKLLAPSVKVKGDGEVECAPYGLRKVEASLLQEYKEDEVIVAHPDYVENFLGEDTEVVGISAMDPLGIGPVTSSFGSDTLIPYNRKKFRELTDRLKRSRHKFKVVLGGSGAWQFAKREYRTKNRYIVYELYQKYRVSYKTLYHIKNVVGLKQYVDYFRF
ncbi:MAG: hypothetical protein QW231_03625 [Candidatus Bathyarchaeia archaeon]